MVCSFLIYGSPHVDNPTIHGLVPRPSLHEIQQWSQVGLPPGSLLQEFFPFFFLSFLSSADLSSGLKSILISLVWFRCYDLAVLHVQYTSLGTSLCEELWKNMTFDSKHSFLWLVMSCFYCHFEFMTYGTCRCAKSNMKQKNIILAWVNTGKLKCAF